jgi:hypothetical protein
MNHFLRRIAINMKNIRNIHNENMDIKYVQNIKMNESKDGNSDKVYILKEIPNYLISDNDVIFITDEKENKEKYMEFNTYN